VSIRIKVILPYLLLTLVVAITGVYVVTKLVASSLNERLTNQLLESGRVVSDGMARQETKHLQVARIVAFTRGLGEAMQQNDAATLSTLAKPIAGGLDAENLIFVNLQGQELLHLVKGSDRTFQDVGTQGDAGKWSFVRALLTSRDPQSLPQRGIERDPANKLFYYFSAIPIATNNQVVGVAIVGTSLNTLLSTLKSTSLADVIFYAGSGQAIATTLAGQENDPGFLNTLSISPALYQRTLQFDNVVSGENLNTDGRWYSLARGRLRVSSSDLGVFGVILPVDFVVTSGAISRNTYIFIFAIAMIAVVLVGYLISRLIINPLYSLMRTSQAIAGGDLTQRTDVRSRDEIGTLANTFDEMTQRLQERSAELERANRILEQMDKTKMSFISVSAHELRTPLTLIQGYSQMLESKTKQDPELKQLSRGLVEGSDRMLEVVNNMLDVTRIDSNMLKLMPTQLLISSLIMRVQKTFGAALKQRNQTLVTEGIEQLPSVFIDPDLMYKVLYHLVINAIKYTPDGGKITISGRLVEDAPGQPQLELVVSDTGIGIDPQHQELVFEKFYQTGELNLHSSGLTKFKGGGPGLGLAIVRGIIEAHGGRVWVESPGHDEQIYPGSHFYIRLPLGTARTK
jgi:signal transduction histidine kinase